MTGIEMFLLAWMAFVLLGPVVLNEINRHQQENNGNNQ